MSSKYSYICMHRCEYYYRTYSQKCSEKHTFLNIFIDDPTVSSKTFIFLWTIRSVYFLVSQITLEIISILKICHFIYYKLFLSFIPCVWRGEEEFLPPEWQPPSFGLLERKDPEWALLAYRQCYPARMVAKRCSGQLENFSKFCSPKQEEHRQEVSVCRSWYKVTFSI